MTMSEDQNLRTPTEKSNLYKYLYGGVPEDIHTPTEKNPVLDAVTSELMGKDRRTTIGNGGCMTCDKAYNLTAEDFRDALSIREYQISGMCQECQDSVFG